MFGQNAPPFYSVLGSSGSSPAPPINYIGATPQLNFATILNTGGFLGNSPATGTVLADGVSYDGAAWTAKDTGAVALQMNGALPGIILYANSGLTPGVAYGPTAALTWLGPGNPWTFADKIDVASLPAADATNAGILTASGNQPVGGNKQYSNTAAQQGTLATWTPGAYTALTAGAENIDINFNLARTVQFATGALSLQRAAVFQAPTYGFVGASTLANAATLAVSGPPIAGTNATITKPWSAIFGTPSTTNLGAQVNAVGVFGAGITALLARNTSNSVEAFIQASTTAAQIGATTNHPLNFITNGANRMQVAAAGDILLNPTGSALATNATQGFTHMPNCAGAPTGTPGTSSTGATPIVVDTTNSKIMVYIGGAWKGVSVA